MAASVEPVSISNLRCFSSLPAVTPADISSVSLGSGSKADSNEKLRAAADLPPFEVLLAWLNYYHTRSGSWPTPPDPSDRDERPARQMTSTQKNSKVKAEAASQSGRTGNMPGERSFVKVDEVDRSNRASSICFDYRTSIYYTAASEIARTSATLKPLSPGALLTLSSLLAWSHHSFFTDKCLTPHAWMSLPLSRWSRELKMRKASLAGYLEELQNAGLVRYGTLNDNILEKAERQRLFEERQEFARLTAGNCDASISNSATTRFTPAYIRIYRLTSPLPQTLPSFDPAPSTPDFRAPVAFKKLSRSATLPARPGHAYTPEPKTKRFPEVKPNNMPGQAVPEIRELLANSVDCEIAPCTCNYLIHDFKTYKNHAKNMAQGEPDTSVPISQRVSPELPYLCNYQARQPGLEKDALAGLRDLDVFEGPQGWDGSQSSRINFSDKVFHFLTNQASFPGYARSDGRQTLDEREAYKFAASPTLSLVGVKQIYYQVLSLWQAGKCNKNPLGFLHNRLNKYLTASGSQTGSGPGEETRSEVGTNSPKTPGLTRAGLPAPLSQEAVENSLELEVSRSGKISPFSKNVPGFASQEEADSNGRANFPPDPAKDLLFGEEVLIDLKKNVVEALAARYRRPDLSKDCDNKEWRVSQAGEELQIRLVEPASQIFPRYFSTGDRSLLGLAISQGLTSLTGKKVAVQLVS